MPISYTNHNPVGIPVSVPVSGSASILDLSTGMYLSSGSGTVFGSPIGSGILGGSGSTGWHDPIQEQLHNLTNRILELESNIRLHDKYPALKEAWEQYQVLKILCLSDEQTEGNSGV